MQEFIEKHRGHINAVLSGFDRLVFRGSLRSLNFTKPSGDGEMAASGIERYLRCSQILFKDYADKVKKISKQVKAASVQPFQQAGRPVVYLASPSQDKDAKARELAGENFGEGLACVLSTVEPSPTFEHRKTHMVRRTRPCPVLYHYQGHGEVGWMYARIQTWFPFNIQVGINGREWLARQLKRDKIRYFQQDNCFPWIEDWERAQQLMDSQLTTDWAAFLNGLAAQLNPLHDEIFGKCPAHYYWTVYQSEWATDIVFRNEDHLRRLMPMLVRHGMLSHSSADVMRYMTGQVTRSGEVPKNYRKELETDFKRREEGERVKYRMNGNSIKFYDKAYTMLGSVLRAAETTINNPEAFRCYRPKESDHRAQALGLNEVAMEGQQACPDPSLDWRPLRKGVADLHRRAEISQKANERVIDGMARADDSRTIEQITARIQQPAELGGRRVRGLLPWGQDKPLLEAVNDGKFFLTGFRNRDLHAQLDIGRVDAEPGSERRRKAAISRLLRILRAHRIIQKIPRTHRYQVTHDGRLVLLAILATAKTSLNQLNQIGL